MSDEISMDEMSWIYHLKLAASERAELQVVQDEKLIA